MLSYEIQVEEVEVKGILYYKDNVILNYTIRYPQFTSNKFRLFVQEINEYYRIRVLLFENDQIQELYNLAKEQYEDSLKNDFPFHPYEVVTEFSVTYNQNCFLSLYSDTYEYTGGAHGNTTRESDTWDLRHRRKAKISDFISAKDLREFLIRNILKQIEEEIRSGNNVYFEDYKNLVEENLNIDNFYLSNEGLVIYFGLYEIAPYVSGIRTFNIPYTTEGVIPPCCAE